MGQFDIIVYNVCRLLLSLDVNSIIQAGSLLKLLYLQTYNPFKEEQNRMKLFLPVGSPQQPLESVG